MKTTPLQILGGLVLLTCMIFATARLDDADRWISSWLPFVVAGVALVFLGSIIAVRGDRRR